MTTTPTLWLRHAYGFTAPNGPVDLTAGFDDGFRADAIGHQGDSRSYVLDQYFVIPAAGNHHPRFKDYLLGTGSYQDCYDIQVTQPAAAESSRTYLFDPDRFDHSEPRSILFNFYQADAGYSGQLSVDGTDSYAVFESSALPSGGFISLWGQVEGGGADQRTSVWFREVSADGTLGDLTTVTDDATHDQTGGVMTVLSGGAVVIGWDDAAPGAATADFTLRRYDDQGRPVADATVVATHDAGGPTAVHALADGGYVALWDDASVHQSSFQLFAADGTAHGDAITFAGDFTGDVTALDDGGFILEAIDGASFLQRYDADGAAIGDHLAAGGKLVTLQDGRVVVADLYSYSIIDPRDYEIAGTARDDIIYGRRDGSEIAGMEGNDTLVGSDVADSLHGGAGRDTLQGMSGVDMLFGSADDDTLIGARGADTLSGGGGDDRLSGGEGGDVLDGGDGADRMTGGAGLDRFTFEHATDSGPDAGRGDTITDFSRRDDRIDLSQIDADESCGGQQHFTFIGTGAFTGPGQVRFVVDEDVTRVEANTRGDKAPEMVITLAGQIGLTAGNFIFDAGRDVAGSASFQAFSFEAVHGASPPHHPIV